jgi:hypothetical protein
MNENDDAHIHFGHKTQAEEQTTSLFNNKHPESREGLEEERIHHNPLLVQDGCAYRIVGKCSHHVHMRSRWGGTAWTGPVRV